MSDLLQTADAGSDLRPVRPTKQSLVKDKKKKRKETKPV